MKFLADLHIHSPYSIATSKETLPTVLHRWARLKGLAVVGTGDFTHPDWVARLERELEPAEEGLFRLREDLAEKEDAELPASCRGPVRFMLSAEISNIYKRAGKTRKVHNLVYVPDFEQAKAVTRIIAEGGAKIASDGRPIAKMDSEELVRRVAEASPEGYVVPAHAWTPHFSLFGAFNRFSSLEECYGEQSGRIFAIETGLSSDPPMNRLVSALDPLTLISNSDSHSPKKLGREANVFDAPLSFAGIREAIRDGAGRSFLGTVEFFPEEGKYHLDGHRACGARMTPEESEAAGGLCPVCGRKVTVGVMNRVHELADRKAPPQGGPTFERLMGLDSVLAELLGVGAGTKRVAKAYMRLVSAFGGELPLLREAPPGEIEKEGPPRIGEAVRRMRRGEVCLEPGYDGQFGKVRAFPA